MFSNIEVLSFAPNLNKTHDHVGDAWLCGEPPLTALPQPGHIGVLNHVAGSA
jgi:hypothetical protein